MLVPPILIPFPEPHLDYTQGDATIIVYTKITSVSGFNGNRETGISWWFTTIYATLDY